MTKLIAIWYSDLANKYDLRNEIILIKYLSRHESLFIKYMYLYKIFILFYI